MKLYRRKKAVIFTTLAIILSLIIVLSLQASETKRIGEKSHVIKTRAITVNNLIKDIENDLSRGVYIAGFRALLSMEEYIQENGKYITNLPQKFRELVENGTIDKEPMNLMTDSTITDWMDRIKKQSGKVGVNVNFTLIGINLNHSSPWRVNVTMGVRYTAFDEKSTYLWERSPIIFSIIDIEEFEDPIYTINSLGRVTNDIKNTEVTQFVSGKDTTKLVVHTNNSWYIAKDDAPSFLMRLEGDLGNSSNGIESLVNVQQLSDQDLVPKGRSVVDHVYFGTEATINYRINQTPSWLLLDEAHLATYDADAESIICKPDATYCLTNHS